MAARSSFATPKLTPAAKWLLIVHVALFVLWVMGGETLQAQMARWLVLTPGSLLDGHVWKLATGPIFTTSGFDAFFDALMLWMFIPTLERFWGTRRFVWFFVWTALVGSAAGVLVGIALGQLGTPVMGLSPFVFACIAAYGVVFYGQEARLFGLLPLKSHVFAIGLAVILAITTVLNARWVSGAASFAAMGLAVLITRRGGLSPNLWWLRARRWWLRRKLGVVDGGRSSSSKQRWMN
jgi:membrane associated rhomboid family serine protease